MINLIDGDLVVYRAAASCEPTKAKPFLEDITAALYRTHDVMGTIAKGTNCNEHIVYIAGENNFRKKLYPEYKANRTRPAPTYLQECREILVTQYGASIVNDMETDDALGIAQTKYDGGSRICSIDKDLLQIPGHHFNWVKGVITIVSPLDGLKTFYKQLIAGDGTDNIPSYDGKVRNSIPKFIEKLQQPIDSMDNELDMYNYVFSVYFTEQGNDDITSIIHRNAQLLYILKEENVFWQPPSQ